MNQHQFHSAISIVCWVLLRRLSLRRILTNPLVKAKDAKGIKEEVEKTDRNRSAYYNYYTQNRWGDAHNYDLAINAALGRETCVKMILDAAAAKEKTLG